MAPMKTTLDLPDELMRAVKIQAVRGNRRLKETVADLLRRGLAQRRRDGTGPRKRVKLPLVRCAHAARPGHEITPKRAADLLLEEEASALGAPLR